MSLPEQHAYMQARRFVQAEHGVRLLVKLSPEAASELVQRLRVQFPDVAHCQSINAGGQFRIVRHRANQVPAELTNEVAAAVLRQIEAEAEVLQPC